ncbi:MAG: hypothetical protein HN909_09175, partial [Phycisphaerales bacterium]|nr:hypothetical protein [Phycisphaerales bacterium]
LRGAPAALSPILAAADMPAPKPAKIPGNALRAIRVRGGAIATEELEGFAYKHGTNIGNWEDSLDGRLEKDADKRERVRHLYRTLGVTKEWAENNYYKLRIVAQNSSLVRVNGFWADYAAHTDGPFVSNHLAEATSTFTEMMFALAVLDLPQTAGKHTVKVDQGALNFTAATPAIAIHEEIKPAEVAAEKLPILVSQNFFRYGDRYTHKNNVKYDKYVTDEFLTGVVYGCHIVITNPTSTRQELAVLLQIPAGAIPVARCKETRSVRVNLDPYRTTTMEYYFYFPVTGQFPHYTTHIAKSEKHITAAPAVVLNVVNKLSKIDKSSWDYISQFGTGEAVIDYLKAHNLHRLNLAKIAWRMKDRAYYRRVIAILRTRHVYNHTLYSYAIYHNDAPTIREYLPYNGSFVSQCGWALESPLLTIDPVERMVYQHLEYLPLVNARAHRLGPDRKIVNETFFQQYNRMLKVLTYRNTLTSAETLAVAYALLLQDRVEEGLAWFDRVDPKALATTMQYDYFKLYTSFYRGDTKTARTLATKHKDHPVDKWRTVFVAALTQLDEIEGKTAKVVDKKDRDQQQTALADTAPSFEFKVEDRKITLDYQNVKAVTINYYKMDIELLFSRNPFVQSQSIAGSGFSYIKPNATGKVDLDPAKKTATLALPEEFANANVLIGISAGGIQRSRAYYANSMNIQMIENYGQVKVTDAKTSKPLTKTYVKVYALMNNGQIKFFKDGYTDLRGRFDYTSLNTTELGQVRKFALLISSDTHGAVIREATPPKR